MSIGLDVDWTGSGLKRILLILNWIRTVKCFKNLGSGPDLDRVNGKNYTIFVNKMLYFVNFLDFMWTWICNFLNFMDKGWTWIEFSKFRTGSVSQNMTVHSSLKISLK